jgi:hypothetical protein
LFKIDQNRITQILADFPGDPKDKVNSLAKNEKELFDAYKLKIWNIIEHMNEQTVYALSKWIIAQDRLLINTYQKKTTPFARGDIVKVELGATNFYLEPSYEHPAIVLAENKVAILIVPGSTKKYGTRPDEIIDAEPSDGFLEPTGLQVQAIRWVSKNRVIDNKKVNTVKSPALMEKIDNYLVQFLPAVQEKLDNQVKLLEERQQEIDRLQTLINEKNKELEEFLLENEELKSELKGITHRHEKQTTVLDMSFGVINRIFERHPELADDFPFARSVLEKDGA